MARQGSPREMLLASNRCPENMSASLHSGPTSALLHHGFEREGERELATARKSSVNLHIRK